MKDNDVIVQLNETTANFDDKEKILKALNKVVLVSTLAHRLKQNIYYYYNLIIIIIYMIGGITTYQ